MPVGQRQEWHRGMRPGRVPGMRYALTPHAELPLARVAQGILWIPEGVISQV